MQLQTILNRVQRHKSFVYRAARFRVHNSAIPDIFYAGGACAVEFDACGMGVHGDEKIFASARGFEESVCG